LLLKEDEKVRLEVRRKDVDAMDFAAPPQQNKRGP